MRETPFQFTYSSEAVIPIKVGELTWRTTNPNPLELNEQADHEELDLVEEIQDQTSLQEVVIKTEDGFPLQRKGHPSDFEARDLMLPRTDVGLNWEVPY